MNKHFSKLFLLGTSYIFATILTAFAQVQAAELKLGRDYEVLPNSIVSGENKKVGVIEFFSYGCLHCANFEPELEAWLKKNRANIQFQRSPVVFPGTSWAGIHFAEIYFTLEAMNELERLHEEVYHVIHKQKLNLADKTVLSNWLKSKQVDPDTFEKTRSSFGVKSQLKIAEKRMNDAAVNSTPQMVVGGKYRVLSTGSFKNILKVTDALIVREEYDLSRKQ